MTRDFQNSELLSAYLDGELNAEEQVDVQRQLRDNPQWQQMLEDLSTLRQQLQSLPQVAPTEDFTQRILRRAERAMLSESGPAATKERAGDALTGDALTGDALTGDALTGDAPVDRGGGTALVDTGGQAGDWRFPSLAIATLAASMLIMVVYFAGRDNELGTTTRNVAMHQPDQSDQPDQPAAGEAVLAVEGLGQPGAGFGRENAQARSLSEDEALRDTVELKALRLELDTTRQKVAGGDEAKSGGTRGFGGGGGFGGGNSNSSGGFAGGSPGQSPAPAGISGNKAGNKADTTPGTERNAAGGGRFRVSSTTNLSENLAADKPVTTRATAEEELPRLANSASMENLWVVEVSMDDAPGRAQVLRYLQSRARPTDLAANTNFRAAEQKKSAAPVARPKLHEKSPKTASGESGSKATDSGQAESLQEANSDLEFVMFEGLPSELSATLTKVASVGGVELRMHQESRAAGAGRFAQVSPVEFFKYYNLNAANTDSVAVDAGGSTRRSLMKGQQPPVAAATPAVPRDTAPKIVKSPTGPSVMLRKEAAAARSAAKTLAPAPTVPAPASTAPASTGDTTTQRAARSFGTNDGDRQTAGRAQSPSRADVNRGRSDPLKAQRGILPATTAPPIKTKQGLAAVRKPGQPESGSKDDRSQQPQLGAGVKRDAEANKPDAKSEPAEKAAVETASSKTASSKDDSVAATEARQRVVRPVRVLIILRNRK